ncbi:phage tail tape measure protein [Salmonella enterica subsp. diarizonae]|nr:phage tail tape measure protein [Salmonella enterica subsp. diarizonae]ECJ5865391.1 phage tail tape measure protein [Salmonella enterica subsp. diarizonae]EEB6126615.1 phage tail tape measure protein [Salmonella enterica subsp. diarizonae]
MDVDTAKVAAGLRTASNGLGKLVDNSDLVEKRIQHCMDEVASEATRLEKILAAVSTDPLPAVQVLEKKIKPLASDIDQVRERVIAFNQKLQEEASQAAAVAQAQDKAAEAFYRQLDSVKQLKGGLQDLERIQSQVQHAKNSGDISQQDYLALISDVTAKKHLMAAADEQAAQSKARFIQSLKQQVATQSLSRAEMLRLKAAELGVSNAADIYIRKLDTAAKSTHALGLKSAMARREIGVLIGELARGNFGALRGSGITLANRAGWLETLMSPKGLMIGGVVGGIAAAVYGLGKAFYEGEKEGEEFNKQLILTGNYAGKTAGQLNEMAKSLAGNGITQHDAAGVLAQVVGSGAFRGGQVETVARAAAKMQEAVGQSVDKTIADFRKLYDEPTKASEELNNQMHYLTASQFQYISALESRGDKEEAGQYAADKYSKAEQQRSQQLIDNLGWIERAIRSATGAWKQFWDAAFDIGRPDTNQSLLNTMQSTLAEIEANKKEGIWGRFKNNSMMVDEDGLREKIKNLQFVMKSQQGYADAQQHLKDVNEEGIKAQIVANKYYSAGLTNAEKRVIVEKEINKAIKANADAAKATQNLSKDKRVEKWSDDYIAKIRAGVEKLYKDPKPHKAPAYHNDEASRLLLQYSQQQAQVEGQIAAAKLSTTEKMTEAHKQLLSFQQRIADLSGKKLTADEKSVLAHKDEIALALQKLDIAQQDLQHQNALNELKKKTVQLTSQLAEEEAKVRQQHAMSLATMGMGDQQRGRYEERLKIQQQYQDKLEQLKRDSKAKGTYGTDEYRQAEQALQDSLDRRLAEWADYNAKVDASQGDWTQGSSRALDNFLTQGGNVAGMTENVFTNAFNGMTDSIANFALTGKMDFRSFTVSILSDLAKMEARIAASKILGGLFQWGMSLFGGGWDSSALHDGTHGIPMPPKLNALGGVYTSSDLSRYSGSVVDRPTFFQFAKGAAVMGEAGPEAILPLRRGTDGKLGVVAAGSEGMAMFAPQYHIAISNTGPELTPQALKAVYDLGKKAAADFVQQQGRDGGRLSGAYR